MIALTVLASGSSANCSALFAAGGMGGAGERLVLVDAGLSPRATRERLYASMGRAPESATDLVLTHLDADHFREGWNRLLGRHPIRVRVHRTHLGEALARGIPGASIVPFDDEIDFGDGLVAQATRMPHDARGTLAFVFELRRGDEVARVGFATDLGRATEALHERFTDLDILAIESNYDPALQRLSPRPAFLKERIMGGRGHLSNEESLSAALRMSRASELKAIVLLHLSRQCNCPRLVEDLWARQAPHLAERMVLASQFHPTPSVAAAPRPPRPRPVELPLFAG